MPVNAGELLIMALKAEVLPKMVLKVSILPIKAGELPKWSQG